MTMAVTALDEVSRRPRTVAIGTFDGVHVGHRAVIEGADTVLTFEPHPLSVLDPPAAPKMIMPFDLKRDVIADLGVAEMVVIPFDRRFSELTAEQFVDRVLTGDLGATEVRVGENFRFGAGASGDAATLRAREEFETHVEPLAVVDGETVSSTRIRKLVEAGEVGEAARCLGDPYTFQGEVIRGEGRGRELGFPTANLSPREDDLVPARGVYAAMAGEHWAAVSVGLRPTFEDAGGLLVEAYLIDHEADLYGQQLRIRFLERLREERAYDTTEELVAQMASDVERAKASCAAFDRT